MYIPLNAAIIVEIYKNSRRKGRPIPKTMTQLYTQLCLTLLQRYLDNINPQNTIVLDKFSDLPNTYSDLFKNLSLLAFEQFQQHRVVFYSDSVGKELVHFGLLDSVPALYGGGGVSYNFLHLTLQEFLAAYHITQLPCGIDVFNQYSMDERWEVVWRFVSGLTGFKYFENCAQNPVFSCLGEGLQVNNLFLHCLFEGQVQNMFECLKATGMDFKTVYSNQEYTSPLDRYALGYCIANCSSTTSWKVEMKDGSDESFMWGLNSDHGGKGIISHLKIRQCNFKFSYIDPYFLKFLEHLEIDSCWLDKIPPINNLTSLSLKSLGIHDAAVLTTLIYSPKLECITINTISQSIPKSVGDILFGPSSINELTLINCEFEESCLDSLEINTNLTKVSLSGCYIRTPLFQTLSKLLRNKKVQKLQIDVLKSSSKTLDLEQVDIFKAALSSNTSLEQLKLVIDHRFCIADESCTHDWSFVTDPRVTTGVFRLVDKKFTGMREMNLELEQAEAPDRVVFKLYTAPGKSEG